MAPNPQKNPMNTTSQKFWDLIESRRLELNHVQLICSVPLKVLLEWYRRNEVPESALRSLQDFLDRR